MSNPDYRQPSAFDESGQHSATGNPEIPNPTQGIAQTNNREHNSECSCFLCCFRAVSEPARGMAGWPDDNSFDDASEPVAAFPSPKEPQPCSGCQIIRSGGLSGQCCECGKVWSQPPFPEPQATELPPLTAEENANWGKCVQARERQLLSALTALTEARRENDWLEKEMRRLGLVDYIEDRWTNERANVAQAELTRLRDSREKALTWLRKIRHSSSIIRDLKHVEDAIAILQADPQEGK